ncbi:hypothetical protein [Paraburkholderia youngii]|uniref:Uncharacterized protein n=1 Tax=Paraburkholderia youngii TaxID=2782701 RepID=A0ABX2NPT7_9BURK|nr:hypothetical protein [Paraburkholderia youngii]NVI06372.1 hypothetical protein [Paraburkholderia youngii]
MQVADCVQMLPGRTANAIQSRMAALKLGPRAIARADWSPEDDAIVRCIWETPGTLKSQMHLLPKRSWRAIHDRGIDLGLGPRGKKRGASAYSWVTEEVDRILGEFSGLTAEQIAKRSVASRTRITQVLKAGHGSKYYVSGWTQTRITNGGTLSAQWTAGKRADVAKPVKKTHAEHSRAFRARRRAAQGPANPFSTILMQVAA